VVEDIAANTAFGVITGQAVVLAASMRENSLSPKDPMESLSGPVARQEP